ncbi:MAG: hypothetical protein J6T90_02620 [Methanomicrobium sp.]|jgi:hypothetical protein|uniref:hypothetical protein n=1 Tax=Methanomicrobium mobile TaxID=2205 RepID=UPI0005B27F50|nr:hypothetical protein [Methanomicrobium mobile]MBO7388442.1 hypothetical protein [Methanomicrobium sp.]MBP5083121.1 hypothetical protein [Methanomicrobium sp.]MBP5475605.1 hypothetical protein [Methanomicrobium sp.]
MKTQSKKEVAVSLWDMADKIIKEGDYDVINVRKAQFIDAVKAASALSPAEKEEILEIFQTAGAAEVKKHLEEL